MNAKLLTFVIIVFTIYFSINAYIFTRGWQALPAVFSTRVTYSILFAFCCLSFLVVMVGESSLPNGLMAVLYPVASTWLAAMLYFLLTVVLFDIVRVANYFFHFLPVDLNLYQYIKLKQILLCSVIVLVAIILSVGYYRFTHPVVTKMELAVAKKAGNLKELRIVMASDIHLGHGIQNKRLKSYVEKINALHPDIILFAGDVIDRDLKFVMEQNMGEELKKLDAPLGVYAVIGNHEYISQYVDKACEYLQQSGIVVLRDSVIKVDSAFYVVGRDDRSNVNRKSLNIFVDSLDKSLPIILLDHQPSHLSEAENAGVDLQLSGHTHRGQMFPLNLITDAVYEVAYGYKLKGHTHIYVSSGLGLWGPPFRIGTKSEIVEITLKFE